MSFISNGVLQQHNPSTSVRTSQSCKGSYEPTHCTMSPSVPHPADESGHGLNPPANVFWIYLSSLTYREKSALKTLFSNPIYSFHASFFLKANYSALKWREPVGGSAPFALVHPAAFINVSPAPMWPQMSSHTPSCPHPQGSRFPNQFYVPLQHLQPECNLFIYPLGKWVPNSGLWSTNKWGFFRTVNRNRKHRNRNRKQNAVHSKGTYCFMKTVSDVLILAYVLGHGAKTHFVLCCKIQKRLKHCFTQAFVPLVRLPPCSRSHCSATPFLMLAQALNRLPAVFFTRCSHKTWPFTMIHKLLLMCPKDCLLLEQTNVLRKEKILCYSCLLFRSGICLQNIQLSHYE